MDGVFHLVKLVYCTSRKTQENSFAQYPRCTKYMILHRIGVYSQSEGTFVSCDERSPEAEIVEQTRIPSVSLSADIFHINTDNNR